jgi:hypothetical protein
MSRTSFAEPADERGTFEVLNGAVNYIGDWAVSMKGAVRTVFIPATIAQALEAYPWLQKHRLFVSSLGREPVSMEWGQVRKLTRR